MPITRIVSGGQTGADRGGLDAASAVHKATDRMFGFVTLLRLGETDRVRMERAVERYAEGSDAVLLDYQRAKKRSTAPG